MAPGPAPGPGHGRRRRVADHGVRRRRRVPRVGRGARRRPGPGRPTGRRRRDRGGAPLPGAAGGDVRVVATAGAAHHRRRAPGRGLLGVRRTGPADGRRRHRVPVRAVPGQHLPGVGPGRPAASAAAAALGRALRRGRRGPRPRPPGGRVPPRHGGDHAHAHPGRGRAPDLPPGPVGLVRGHRRHAPAGGGGAGRRDPDRAARRGAGDRALPAGPGHPGRRPRPSPSSPAGSAPLRATDGSRAQLQRIEARSRTSPGHHMGKFVPHTLS